MYLHAVYWFDLLFSRSKELLVLLLLQLHEFAAHMFYVFFPLIVFCYAMFGQHCMITYTRELLLDIWHSVQLRCNNQPTYIWVSFPLCTFCARNSDWKSGEELELSVSKWQNGQGPIETFLSRLLCVSLKCASRQYCVYWDFTSTVQIMTQSCPGRCKAVKSVSILMKVGVCHSEVLLPVPGIFFH